MSSALRAEQSSRTWWSLSSKSSKQDLHKQYANDRSTGSTFKNSPSKTFPSFASVIGLKSKKHPTLAIQDPPSSLTSHPTPRPLHPEIPPQFRLEYQTRNRLKSAPQPLSPADSLEPLTPLDGFRSERQSLLTLSDADPFAPRGITLHAPNSPTRLSAHSGNSFLDVSLGQNKSSFYVRGSYSSSSSNSYSPREPQSQGLLKAHDSTIDVRTLSSSKSLSNLQKVANHLDPEPPLPHVPQRQTSTSDSRTPARSRGMTDAGYTRPPFLQEAYSGVRTRRPSSPGRPPSAGLGATHSLHSLLSPGSQPSSRPSSRPSSAGRTTPNQLASASTGMKPQSISRQASIQRLHPPTAPPTHDLPAPPLRVTEEPMLEDELDIPIACNSSLSSSSLSFVSSHSSGKDAFPSLLDLHRRRERKKSDGDKLSFISRLKLDPETDAKSLASTSKSPLDTSLSSRVMRKTPSLTSLNKRLPPTQTPNSSSSEPPTETHKVLRKQRSHHRLPIPPISLGLKHSQTSSVSTPPSPQASEPSVVFSTLEQRGSVSSNTSVFIPVRKRVFSGASLRRPSTSSGIPPPPSEDDTRSLFSLRSDHGVFTHTPPIKPWPTSISALGSFSDDQLPPLSPVHSEYTPQRIMSPEDLARVEAELDDISIVSPLPPPTVPLPSIRQRTTSASTIFSDRDSEIIPPSVFSLALSDSIGSPQVSATTKPPKPGAVPMGTLNEAGAGNGRISSVSSKSSTAPPRNHRPATSSGASTFAPMSAIPEPKTSRPVTTTIDASTAPDTQPSPVSPISPLNIKKTRRKNSNSSTNPPMPQMKSLPPPPRPRAKAEVVTVIDSRRDPPAKPSEGGKRASIGVDFGHGQRYGHVVSPSVQSMNSGFSTSSATAINASLPPSRPPHASHHVPPIPPRAVSRPPPPSYRKPRVPVDNQQRSPSIGGQKTPSRRMSLQRKPSFLYIDDDDDVEPETNLDFNTIMRMSSASSGASFSRSDYTSESFLEFGRESFDTVRSAEFGH